METLALEVSQYELERGKPRPSWNHGIIQANLIIELGVHYRKQYRLASEINIEVAGRVMVPDIGIFPAMALDMANDNIVARQLPLTTIEILSPTQALADLINKAASYFQAGVKSCWIVVPEVSGIFMYSAPGEYLFFHKGQTLTDPATGIELPLGLLFE